MDKKIEAKFEKLEALSKELSDNISNRMRVVHMLVRDAQLNLETFTKIVDIQNGHDQAQLKQRAHEFSQKIQKELDKKNPDIGLVLNLLLTKSILIDPTNPSLKQLGDIVKSMGAASPSMPRGDLTV